MLYESFANLGNDNLNDTYLIGFNIKVTSTMRIMH